MGRRFLSSNSYVSRSLYTFRIQFLVLACFFAFYLRQQLYLSNRESLAAKYSPTTFHFQTERLYGRFDRLGDEHLRFQQELVANRASWKPLGRGWEGTTYIYKDSVIKRFSPQSPLRNCEPGGGDQKWPTEIPASLYFGGTQLRNNERNRSTDGFLQVSSFFKVSADPTDPPEWHLVTPLLESGSLEVLARKLLNVDQGESFRARDAAFRPAFHRLLTSLDILHRAGYCHDDIKPGNIFIQDTSHWVLGDLGNVRNTLHPYHSSRLWKRNKQLTDCRANDVIRLLKSYLQFIRSSVADGDAFDAALYGGQEPAGRLFWWAMADAQTMSALELQRRSLIEHPAASRSRDGDEKAMCENLGHVHPWSLFPRRAALRHTVDGLLATRNSETRARWLGLVWIFGMPVLKSC